MVRKFMLKSYNKPNFEEIILLEDSGIKNVYMMGMNCLDLQQYRINYCLNNGRHWMKILRKLQKKN